MTSPVDTNHDPIPALVGFEEDPAGLSEAWKQFFGCCWSAYDLILQRRSARQRAANDVISVCDNHNPNGEGADDALVGALDTVPTADAQRIADRQVQR